MLPVTTEPPIQTIDFSWYGPANGVTLAIKREDLLHPFVSGNKWRKLRYVLEDARANQRTHLVSFGGAYSNHLVALASAGQTFGFRTTGFVRGEEVDNHMLTHCRNFGMQLIFVSRTDYRNKPALFQQHFGSDHEAYFIDEGGRGELAARGCEHILHEAEGFTHVVCAVGTGTTIAGIARAARTKGIIAEGVCVLKGATEMDIEIETLAGYPVCIHHQYHRGGYAKTDAALLDFMRAFYEHTDIELDQVYTAKTTMAVLDLIQNGHYASGSRVLLIHTGGVLGNTAASYEAATSSASQIASTAVSRSCCECAAEIKPTS